MVQNILITGISRGLGLSMARYFLEHGASVYGVSRFSNDCIRELDAHFPGRFQTLQADLAEPEMTAEKIFAELLPLETPIHGFINNAARAYDDVVTNLQFEPLEEMYRVNVFAPLLITKRVIRNMIYHRIPGSIVHISSISVHTGYKGLAMYASTKGALEAFSKNTAREWGPRGIRSNCIVAGFMETDMSSELTDDQRTRIYRRTALGKPTKPEDVAAMAAHLLSDAATSVTGQNFFVDSGTV